MNIVDDANYNLLDISDLIRMEGPLRVLPRSAQSQYRMKVYRSIRRG